MRKKLITYLAGGVAILLVAYHSVYFKRLDEVKAAQAGRTFNAAAYAQTLWNQKMIPGLGKAVEIKELLPMLSADPAQAFDRYSHALGIGNLRYFLVRGEGKVTAVDADDITVAITGTAGQTVRIATEYIFGNAARDATGMVDINDFTNTMDFNNVSAELNKIIRSRVLPLLKNRKVGDTISFAGAVELNKEHLNLSTMEAIPVAVRN